MKKADLVAAAERRLAESRWLPQLLRHSSNTWVNDAGLAKEPGKPFTTQEKES